MDTGIMDEPQYRVWMQEWASPSGDPTERPGRWVAETQWPTSRIGQRRLFLNAGRLAPAPESPATRLAPSSPQSTGANAGEWCAFGSKRDLPSDQREDDARSLLFDSEPLAERTEILGALIVELELSVDRPVALVAVRLNDVAPDGSLLRVTYGVLNLTHRDGHERRLALEPGHRYRVVVPLNDVAHAFPQGHVVRVAVSTC